MSVSVDFHMDAKTDVVVRISSTPDGKPYGVLELRNGSTTVRLFMNNTEQVDKVAFFAETMARETRDAEWPTTSR